MDSVFDNIHARLAVTNPAHALGSRGDMDTSTPTSIERIDAAPSATAEPLPQAALLQMELPEVPVPLVDLTAVELPTSAEVAANKETSARAPGSIALAESAFSDMGASTAAELANTSALPDSGAAAGAETSDGAPASRPPEGAAEPSARMLSEASSRAIGFAFGAAALLLAVAALVVALRRRRHRSSVPPVGRHALMTTAYLNDILGVSGRMSYPLNDKPVVVGRLSEPESEAAGYVVIDESTIGRRHALIEYKDHSFWVTDQKSLNGTFVNNRRIDSPTRLKHGDRIRFHKHEFEFLVLEMFETDRTMMSETLLAEAARRAHAHDERAARIPAEGLVGEQRKPVARDPRVTRH